MLAVARHADADVLAVTHGVVDEVRQAALEGAPAQRQGDRLDGAERDGAALAAAAGHHLVEQRREVGGGRLLAFLAAGEGEVALDHALHLGDVGFETGHAFALALHGELQLHPGQRRAQVVADAGEQLGALGDLAPDALAHDDEGGRRLAHLAGALGLEIAHRQALAEAVGGLGEAAHRADLVAQEEDGDGEQHDRGADHPHDEDVGGAAEHPLARGGDVEHPVFQLDADHKPLEPAFGIDREGAPELRRERPFEHREENAEAGLGQHGKRAAGFGLDVEAEIEPGGPQDEGPVAGLGKGLDQLDHRGDVIGQAERQVAAHGVPMAFVEDVGGDELEQHQRRDDDQERPAEQRARHEALEDHHGAAAPGAARRLSARST